MKSLKPLKPVKSSSIHFQCESSVVRNERRTSSRGADTAPEIGKIISLNHSEQLQYKTKEKLHLNGYEREMYGTCSN